MNRAMRRALGREGRGRVQSISDDRLAQLMRDAYGQGVAHTVAAVATFFRNVAEAAPEDVREQRRAEAADLELTLQEMAATMPAKYALGLQVGMVAGRAGVSGETGE